MLLSSSLSLSAQNLDLAAARERERRKTAVASASKVFTEEDLGRYAGQRLPEAASQLPSDQQPAARDRLPDGEAQRQDAYVRHWTSAEAYLKQCEDRLRAAKESWLAASEASQADAATRARRAVENAAGALERARKYRDQAEVAARLAGAPPAGLL
jgi:Xaa-Pro aminopeptidase